ncbi:enoyl-CoA hydratase-related protein [Methylibium sp.]|uniref:enoyl-CoA hydratase-related protein n=1 Tax=Methylibium sp. TaxID=2067992 RepID=UPI003D0C5198
MIPLPQPFLEISPVSQSVLTLKQDARGVAYVTLNRPAVHNAFDEALIAELHAAIDGFDHDDAVRVIVLASAGRHFCAGADIGWMQRAAAHDEVTNLADARKFAEMMRRLGECSKPIVARVQGAAYGGGFGLLCTADIVVAETRARFAVSEARFGILPAVIGPYVINAVGQRQARRLALTCQPVNASQALAMGLVHDVVEDTSLDDAVERQVTALLANGPRAQGEIKKLFRQLAPGEITAQVQELTASTISRVRITQEAIEGFRAFLAKRPPAWSIGSESPSREI